MGQWPNRAVKSWIFSTEKRNPSVQFSHFSTLRHIRFQDAYSIHRRRVCL